jgi:hypothetical protein
MSAIHSGKRNQRGRKELADEELATLDLGRKGRFRNRGPPLPDVIFPMLIRRSMRHASVALPELILEKQFASRNGFSESPRRPLLSTSPSRSTAG